MRNNYPNYTHTVMDSKLAAITQKLIFGNRAHQRPERKIHMLDNYKKANKKHLFYQVKVIVSPYLEYGLNFCLCHI